MDELKVYSIRLELDSIAWADKLADDVYYWTRSDVLRLAIWVAEKVINSRNARAFSLMKYEEEFKGRTVILEDVLRTAGVKLENLKTSE